MEGGRPIREGGMARDPRYDILFEPVKIGPVTLRNRFYQVPHCNGLGSNLPRGHAGMREVKAEGGWAAVCTEILSIHPSSDSWPFAQVKLWEGADVKSLAILTEAIHRHGALAGAELAHGGFAVANRYTRDLRKAHWTADRLEAGTVFVNKWFAGGNDVPFGGMKRSGFGREKGVEALYNYIQTRNVAIKY